MKKFTRLLPLLCVAASLCAGCRNDHTATGLLPPPSTNNGGSWEWQNPLPQGNTLNDLAFVDALYGWAVGDNGTIMHTTDGGSTWVMQSSLVEYSLRRIFALDVSTAWILARSDNCSATSNGSTILRTTDGGQLWTSASFSATLYDYYCLDICFADRQTGWLIGDGDLYGTTDGGDTWVQNSLPIMNACAVTCLSATDLWVVGQGSSQVATTLHSTDDGATWLTVDTLSNSSFSDVQILNTGTGWVSGYHWSNAGSLIRYTTDGGQSWETHNTEVSYNPCRIKFVTPSIGWMWSSYTTSRTFDGGRTWEDLHVSQNAFAYVNESLGWCTTRLGYVQHTVNGGTSWNDQGESFFSNYSCDFQFTDNLHGWYCDQSQLFHSSDGGYQWIAQSNTNLYSVQKVWFYNQNIGWAMDRNQRVARTTDAGGTWTVGDGPGTGYDARDFCFPDIRHGWSIGHDGTVQRTRDGGTTWEALPCSTSLSLLKVSFADSLNGSVLYQTPSWDKGIMQTRDGGHSWSYAGYASLSGANDIAYAAPSSGWMVGNGGMMLFSNDTGQTWTIHSSGTEVDLNAIASRSADDIWVAGDCGMILHTTNRGQDWQQFHAPTTKALLAMSVSENGHIWAGGYDGQLIHFTPDQLLAASQE
jgi:photosystem II stability/assembly factor-like uncharacterized protein